MKQYKVDYATGVRKLLRNMDRPTAARIYRWIDKHLENCENPRQHGHALTGPLADYWRYRVGDYRLVAEIHDHIVTIIIVDIGHRSDVYDKH